MDESNVRIASAEAIGTAVLVIGGCGAAVLAGGEIGFMGVSLAFGLSLMVMAFTIGGISGCHINPAVTIGLVVAGKTEGSKAPFYIGGQLVGAAIGALILFLIANGVDGFSASDSGFATNGFDDRSPGGYNLFAVAIAEIVMTAFLLLAVLGTTHKKFPAGFTALSVGWVLVLIHLVSIPVSNTSVNPARSFGPALFVGDALVQLWAFIVFPIIGAVGAALLWKGVLAPDSES